jgi:phosphoribosylformylglycinamidine cyclo-ligase
MLTYKTSGVDIDAGTELVERIKKMCPSIGGFGGLFPLGDSFLVAGTDGVGTKLKIALAAGKHDSIGIDLVAMCVNDIITSGAKPLFFLDYFATSKLDVDQAEEVIKGILKGCKESNCILLGGETAEMPGFYQEGEYDVAGFAVGIVDKNDLIDGSTIESGDVIVGIPSTGVHSNGYSLVRKIISDNNINTDLPIMDLKEPLIETLLRPTALYVKTIQEILKYHKVKGIAHITGGGLPENAPRMLPKGLGITIDKKSWIVPKIFQWLQKTGNVPEDDMFRTFNMGIGMTLALSPQEAESLCNKYPEYKIIGKVINGEGCQCL